MRLHCGDCETPMELRSAEGLHVEAVRGVSFTVGPTDLKLWTCSSCGEYYSNLAEEKQLELLVHTQVLEWKELHGSLCPTAATIDEWLDRQRKVTPEWVEPLRTTGAWDQPVLEWWSGDKKLTLHFYAMHTEYVRVWGADVVTGMDDGLLDGNRKLNADFVDLWLWLTKP